MQAVKPAFDVQGCTIHLKKIDKKNFGITRSF